MIINKIRAQNVLKYRELSIDLAAQGLIAISGQNESGKSSIGETVCFALFGRTFSITPDDIAKVVRWGENHCAVTLEFSVEDRRYALSRFLDSDGNHSAKLVLADDPEAPLARGVQQVSEALFAILGFAYDEFVESFYLAQREITTPHPHSQAVKIMAGVAPLERVADTLNDEIAERQELIGEIKAEWDTVDQDVKALGIQQGHMPKLEDAHYQIEQQLGRVNGSIEAIDAGLDAFVGHSAEIERARGAKGRASALRFLVFLLALACAGLWALLSYGQGLPEAATARDLLAQYIPQWDDSKVIWLAYIAAGLGVVFLLLWVRVAGRRRRIAELLEQLRGFGEVLGEARAIEIDDAEEAVDDRVEAMPPDDGEVLAEEATAEQPPRPARDEYEGQRRKIDQGEASVRRVREYCERESVWLAFIAGQLAAQLAELDEEIDEEQARLREALNLSEVLNGLTDKRDDVQRRIDDRRRGLELLAGAIAHRSDNFNREVKALVGKLLPLFTDGRYEHLQIDNALKVRVFSSDKHDFMDLDEISSGTQRQIMLALRLALSKKLLSRTVKGRQFAFLDEPFAFFDQERTRRALHALADLGDDISQVWIVAQGFPENCEIDFDTKIDCDRNSDTLVVTT